MASPATAVSVTRPDLLTQPVSKNLSDAVVLGAPGSLAAWVYAAVQAAAKSAVVPFDTLWIDREHQIPPARGPRILLSQYPSLDLIAQLQAGLGPAVVILEDPIDLVWHHRRAYKTNLAEGLKTISAAFVANAALRHHPRLFFVQRGLQEPLRDVLWRLVHHLGMTMNPKTYGTLVTSQAATDDPEGQLTLEATIAKRMPHYGPPQRFARTAPEHELSGRDATIISQVLDPLFSSSIGRTSAPIHWPPAVFLNADKPGEPIPERIDVTGPSRNLVYGPYIALPPGLYDGEIVLEPSPDLVPMRFSVELHGADQIARVVFTLEHPLAQAVSFRFEHLRSAQGIEIRLRNENGTLSGTLVFHGFTLTPVMTP